MEKIQQEIICFYDLEKNKVINILNEREIVVIVKNILLVINVKINNKNV